MANDVTRQGRVERFAAAPLARMFRNLNFGSRFLGNRRPGRGRSLGFVEEQILLLGAAYFRLGIEQFAQMRFQTFFEQADFDLQRAHLAA